MPAVNHELRSDLKSLPWHASTKDVCALDDGFYAFVKSISKKAVLPALVVTRAKHFATLVPTSLQHCPAWVIWLSNDFSEEIVSLAHQEPTVHNRKSKDLLDRDPILVWGAQGWGFTAFASPLLESINAQKDGGHIVVIFATPTQVAVRALNIGFEFLQDLSIERTRCMNYRPVSEHTAEELRAARQLECDPYEWELDDAGRKVILLLPRTASWPDRVI